MRVQFFPFSLDLSRETEDSINGLLGSKVHVSKTEVISAGDKVIIAVWYMERQARWPTITPTSVSDDPTNHNLVEAFLRLPVSALGELSVRAANSLINVNIKTVGQLLNKGEQGLMKYRNFGKKTIDEIKEKFLLLGVTFPQ